MEAELREKIKTDKYSFNIVRETQDGDKTEFVVVFFVDQPARPISEEVTFNFAMSGGKVQFRVSNTVFWYDLDKIDLKTIIDREYNQRLRFKSDL